MARRKKTKPLTIFSRNSYIGRIKGVVPAFLPGRCKEITGEEQLLIEGVHRAIKSLLTIMESKS